MVVMFTQEAERRRNEARERNAKEPVRPKGQWHYIMTFSKEEAIRYAIKKGWADNKVQVKAYPVNDVEFEYVVEPFEKDCRCPNLLRYSDYVGGGDKDTQ